MDVKQIIHQDLTLIENFHIFKSFIVERSKLDKVEHDNLFKLYEEKILHPVFKEILKDYYNESKNASLLSRQSAILANYLVKLHFENINALSGDHLAAQRMMDIPYMKEACAVLSKDLLDGKMDPASTMAAKEAEDIRKQLQSRDFEVESLKEKNGILTTKLNQVSTALQNLINNIRSKFNLSEHEILEAMKKPSERKVKEENNKVQRENQTLKI